MTALAAPRVRTPRFRRVGDGTLALRQIHEDALAAVGRYGLLDSGQISRLVPTIGADRLKRHLASLYHHGFLSRPRGQIAALFDDGSRRRLMVYTLGHRGVQHFEQRHRFQPRRIAPSVGRGFLAHEVEIRDALIDINLLCRKLSEVDFLLIDEVRDWLPPCPDDRRDDEWKVGVRFPQVERTILVKPDAIFALRNREAAPDRARWGFLELDRATMTVASRDLEHGSSVLRKFAAYAATFAEGIHRARGMSPARAFFVTTTEKRVRLMVEAFREHAAPLGLPQGFFRFTDRKTLEACPDLFALTWLDGAGQARSLIA